MLPLGCLRFWLPSSRNRQLLLNSLPSTMAAQINQANGFNNFAGTGPNSVGACWMEAEKEFLLPAILA
jgi:hypothetical protein